MPCRSARAPRLSRIGGAGHRGDMVSGIGNTQIAALVEPQTRYVMLVKLKSNDAQSVVNALLKKARKLSWELCKQSRWDQGTEMHGH